MHSSVQEYLTTLVEKRRSPLTIKAVRQDLTRFITWWEQQHQRNYDPNRVLESDLRDWRRFRQNEEGAAPATINRALASLRGYCS
ncbi:MAG TPA: site-specific integrase [Ktedonobacteraceae bacterium]|nr:site-specific integrase [Ktedonobacteraceae bacterium]